MEEESKEKLRSSQVPRVSDRVFITVIKITTLKGGGRRSNHTEKGQKRVSTVVFPDQFLDRDWVHVHDSACVDRVE